MKEFEARSTKREDGVGHHRIKISILHNGALSFFNLEDGDSFIYLYPSQVKKLEKALKQTRPKRVRLVKETKQ